MLLRIGEVLAITQRGDRSALDELEFILDQTIFDVLGRPKWASLRRPTSGEPQNCANRDGSECVSM